MSQDYVMPIEDKSPKVSKKLIDNYNSAALSILESEDFNDEGRIKCIRIVGDYIEYYNCKTGEAIPPKKD